MQHKSHKQHYNHNVRNATKQSNLVKIAFQRKDDRQSTSPNKYQGLEDRELDFRTLIEKANAMILVIQDNNICYANPMIEETIGYTKEELLNKRELFQQFQLTQDQEISLLTKDGNRCWLDCSISSTQFARQPATLITAVDITKYKQRKERAEEISQSKDTPSQSQVEFISMISHELRTPLNVIAFSYNLLRKYYDSWSEQRKQECLDRISRSIEAMSLLIDKTSIVSKAQAQKLRFVPQPLEVNQFCQILLSDLQLVNDRVGIINFYHLGDCGKVLLDHNLLRLILTNLLENAIKYSPRNRAIDFTLITNDDEILFKIEDRGIGIAVEDRQQLLEPFYRGNNVGELPGDGLGLAVVKQLVDVHGGSIAINSQIGIGTEIMVSLPKKPIESKVSNLKIHGCKQ